VKLSPRGLHLAAAIEERFGIRPELVKGGDGIFRVAVNGSILFDKGRECGGFPTNEQIFELIERSFC